MNFPKLAVGASMLALGVAYAGSATAQSTDDKMMMNYPDRGFYISGNIGGHETMDSEVDGGGIDSTVETDRGIAGLVGLG